MSNVTEIRKNDNIKNDMLAMVDKIRADIVSGRVTRLGLVYEVEGDKWGTEFCTTDDQRKDAAMLIELGLRTLSFSTRNS